MRDDNGATAANGAPNTQTKMCCAVSTLVDNDLGTMFGGIVVGMAREEVLWTPR